MLRKILFEKYNLLPIPKYTTHSLRNLDRRVTFHYRENISTNFHPPLKALKFTSSPYPPTSTLNHNTLLPTNFHAQNNIPLLPNTRSNICNNFSNYQNCNSQFALTVSRKETTRYIHRGWNRIGINILSNDIVPS